MPSPINLLLLALMAYFILMNVTVERCYCKMTMGECAAEKWLLAVETGMCATLAKDMFRCFQDMKKTKREKWIKDWPGQMSLTSGQLAWTVECTKALHAL